MTHFVIGFMVASAIFSIALRIQSRKISAIKRYSQTL